MNNIGRNDYSVIRSSVEENSSSGASKQTELFDKIDNSLGDRIIMMEANRNSRHNNAAETIATPLNNAIFMLKEGAKPISKRDESSFLLGKSDEKGLSASASATYMVGGILTELASVPGKTARGLYKGIGGIFKKLPFVLKVPLAIPVVTVMAGIAVAGAVAHTGMSLTVGIVGGLIGLSVAAGNKLFDTIKDGVHAKGMKDSIKAFNKDFEGLKLENLDRQQIQGLKHKLEIFMKEAKDLDPKITSKECYKRMEQNLHQLRVYDDATDPNFDITINFLNKYPKV
jgi:hypothetical protein